MANRVIRRWPPWAGLKLPPSKPVHSPEAHFTGISDWESSDWLLRKAALERA